jgi:hypothetical protein
MENEIGLTLLISRSKIRAVIILDKRVEITNC